MKTFRILLFSLFVAASIFSSGAQGKDQWIQVKSKNFFLIGNASEKDLKRVGTRLEQFRETFRNLFRQMRLTASIPTNVVVFKSDSSYKPFKPKRADGKIDTFVAGYFQPGEDVNYITLSTEGEDQATFGTIFHEYVHFVIDTNFGKSEVPAWFNEGLAEYYQTFAIEDDIRVKLGLPQAGHLQMLQQTNLMPLDTLFGISNRQLINTGSHSRSIFYAQSWALVHYFLQTGKGDQMGLFLDAMIRGVPARQAFQDVFKTDYPAVERELKKYVEKRSYQYSLLTFKNKLTFDGEMTVTPMDEATSNAYLGDLLFHTNRADEAESFLNESLKANPTSSMANVTLGMVKLRQRKFDEARALLEKAIAGDPRNHLAYYRYAYLLSREAQDEFGMVREFPEGHAAKMRDALKKAIAINPEFTESYEMLAYVAVVTNDKLDEAIKGLQTALKHQPGSQRYALRIAEILMRQSKLADARAVAEKISRTTDDAEVKQRADQLLEGIDQMAQFEARREAQKKEYEAAAKDGGQPRLLKGPGRPLTEAEAAKLAERQKAARIRGVNQLLREPAANEQRVMGRITKIDCKARPLVYTVVADNQTFSLTSNDFQGLAIMAYEDDTVSVEIGCDADLSPATTLLTYRAADGKPGTRGELVAIEFVPRDFRLMTSDELKAAFSGPQDRGAPPPPATQAEMDAAQRNAMFNAMRQAMQKPAAGEKREMGFLEKVECSSNTMYFYIRTPTATLKLANPNPAGLQIVYFVQDLADTRIGCGMKPVEFPVVAIFADKPDKKGKPTNEVRSLEFVPKSFNLEP